MRVVHNLVPERQHQLLAPVAMFENNAKKAWQRGCASRKYNLRRSLFLFECMCSRIENDKMNQQASIVTLLGVREVDLVQPEIPSVGLLTPRKGLVLQKRKVSALKLVCSAGEKLSNTKTLARRSLNFNPSEKFLHVGHKTGNSWSTLMTCSHFRFQDI